FPSPFIAYRTVVADSDSVCPALVADRHLSRYTQVYAYESDDAAIPANIWPSYLLDPTEPNGAYHISANTLLFMSSQVAAASPDQAALVDEFTNQTVGYVRQGDPTAPGTPVWTPFTRHGQLVMTLAPAGDSALTPGSTIEMQHHCGFWDAVTHTSYPGHASRRHRHH
ncbi:MAG: hypothetical protein ACRDNS_16225, partial [Trebonia sp.]